MSSGRLFEDFVPISDTRALVTTGETLGRLDSIESAYWTLLADGRVKVEIPPKQAAVMARGGGLRLGGLFGGKLLYSDRERGVVGAEVASLTAHQPFLHMGDVYYTDSWPLVLIYHGKHKIFLDHFKKPSIGRFPDVYLQVGNPHWTPTGIMYFEARKDPGPARPELWEVWKRLSDGTLEKVCMGANPAYYNGRLFWGEWNGRCFDYQSTVVD